MANQRTAIIAGLQQSLEIFQKGVEGVTAKEAMDLVLITQYFDTIKEIGANNRTNTIFIPHSPSGLADVSAQIRTHLFQQMLQTPVTHRNTKFIKSSFPSLCITL